MIKCINTLCKFNSLDKKCELKNISIGSNGKCEKFQKGFLYYFLYFSDKLESSNMIPLCSLDDRMRYCIYYLMKCLPIEFGIDDIRGILTLRHSKTHKILCADDIWDMIGSDELNTDILNECIKEFNEHGLPNQESSEKDANNSAVYKDKEYGWLSPMGVFMESPWGTHDESAYNIIKSKNWRNDYDNWSMETLNTAKNNYRDFLIQKKRYVLIHNPSATGGYIVTHTCDLTKKQKDFLYKYFIDMGMKLRAEKYLI